MKVPKLAKALIALALLIVYLRLGAIAFRALEQPAEEKTMVKYCLGLDGLLKRMPREQRTMISTMFNLMVGEDLCRAPACKVEALPVVNAEFQLTLWADTDCAEAMQSRLALSRAIQSELTHCPTITAPLVIIRECKNSLTTTVASGNQTEMHLVVEIKSDLPEQVWSIASNLSACDLDRHHNVADCPKRVCSTKKTPSASALGNAAFRELTTAVCGFGTLWHTNATVDGDVANIRLCSPDQPSCFVNHRNGELVNMPTLHTPRGKPIILLAAEDMAESAASMPDSALSDKQSFFFYNDSSSTVVPLANLELECQTSKTTRKLSGPSHEGKHDINQRCEQEMQAGLGACGTDSACVHQLHGSRLQCQLDGVFGHVKDKEVEYGFHGKVKRLKFGTDLDESIDAPPVDPLGDSDVCQNSDWQPRTWGGKDDSRQMGRPACDEIRDSLEAGFQTGMLDCEAMRALNPHDFDEKRCRDIASACAGNKVAQSQAYVERAANVLNSCDQTAAGGGSPNDYVAGYLAPDKKQGNWARGGVLYAMSTFTTARKVLSIFYTLIGVALFLYNLDIFSELVECALFSVVKRKHELGATFAIFLVWMLVMGAITQHVEGWEYYGDALYYSFITSTTIGFGDFAPEKSLNTAFGVVGMVFLIFGGVFWFAMFLKKLHAHSKAAVVAGILAVFVPTDESEDSKANVVSWSVEVARCLFAWAILIFYMLLGAAVVQQLEYESNKQDAQLWWRKFDGLKHRFNADIQSLAQVQAYLTKDTDVNHTVASRVFYNNSTETWGTCGSDYTSIADATLKNQSEALVNLFEQNVNTLLAALNSMGTCAEPVSCDADLHWNFAPSTLYAFTVFTTIGYGHFNAKSTGGKTFVVLYAVIGFVIFGYASRETSAVIVKFFHSVIFPALSACTPKACWESYTARIGRFQIPLLAVVLGGSYFFVGAGFYYTLEQKDFSYAADGYAESEQSGFVSALVNPNTYKKSGATHGGGREWTFFDSFWFGFISSTTVGFGDYTPDWQNPFVAMLQVFWVFLGVTLIGVLNDAIQRFLEVETGEDDDEEKPGTGVKQPAADDTDNSVSKAISKKQLKKMVV